MEWLIVPYIHHSGMFIYHTRHREILRDKESLESL